MPAIAARVPGGKKALIALAFLLTITAIAGLNVYRSRQQIPVSVVTAAVEIENMGTAIMASGSIELVEKQEVYAPDNRLVREVPVRIGDEVKKGDIIVSLEADSEALSLLDAEARLAEEEAAYEKYFHPSAIDTQITRAEYNRAELAYQSSLKNAAASEKLYESGAISLKDLDTAKTQLASDEITYLQARKAWDINQNGPAGAERRSYETAHYRAQEAVKLAEENLDQFVVPARIDGKVMAVQVSAGDVPSAGQHLVTIGDPKRLEVKVGIGEYDAARVKKGQAVIIEAAAFPDQQFKGKVIEVSQRAFTNQGSQSQQIEIPIRIAVDSEQIGLLPGFTVDVKIITVPEKKRLVVPYEAIIEKNGRSYVYIVENGQTRRVQIKTGLKGDLSVEVTDGLKKDDVVILNPAEDLKDGQAIKITANPAEEGKQP